MFYVHFENYFQYLNNIKPNIMTTNNKSDNTMKGPIT
jgi:hypothetical protein